MSARWAGPRRNGRPRQMSGAARSVEDGVRAAVTNQCRSDLRREARARDPDGTVADERREPAFGGLRGNRVGGGPPSIAAHSERRRDPDRRRRRARDDAHRNDANWNGRWTMCGRLAVSSAVLRPRSGTTCRQKMAPKAADGDHLPHQRQGEALEQRLRPPGPREDERRRHRDPQDHLARAGALDVVGEQAGEEQRGQRQRAEIEVALHLRAEELAARPQQEPRQRRRDEQHRRELAPPEQDHVVHQQPRHDQVRGRARSQAATITCHGSPMNIAMNAAPTKPPQRIP